MAKKKSTKGVTGAVASWELHKASGPGVFAHKPYFYKWMEQCKKLPEDMWQPATKRSTKKTAKMIVTMTKKANPIKIADMHTMQLVNAIKWCSRQAGMYLNSGCFNLFSTTKAELLAQVPQWRSLLMEGKKRELFIIGNKDYYLPWFEDAMKAIVFRELGK